MWNLKTTTTAKKQAHRYIENRLVVTRGRGWEMGELGIGVKRYKLLVIK